MFYSPAEACCFTGHRALPGSCTERIKAAVRAEILVKYRLGVRYFLTGGALGFDTLASELLIQMKAELPDIIFILVVPCEDQDKYWSYEQKREYRAIKTHADGVVQIQRAYTRDCMLARNRYMVDHSRYVISFCTHKGGGTYYTVRYASGKGKLITEISRSPLLQPFTED